MSDFLARMLAVKAQEVRALHARPDAAELFAGLRCVVVDEWHELLASKRGVQVELALAHGKRQYDKRATIAERGQKRDLDRDMKKYRKR